VTLTQFSYSNSEKVDYLFSNYKIAQVIKDDLTISKYCCILVQYQTFLQEKLGKLWAQGCNQLILPVGQ